MKTEHDIETLLRTDNSFSLSAAEKEIMKKNVMAHAAVSLSTPLIPSPFTVLLRRGVVSIVMVLMVVGTAVAAQDAQPGESLYVVKVQVVEELAGFTKFNPTEKLAHDMMLMERRLDELTMLTAETEVLENETVALVQSQIELHVSEVLASVATLGEDETYTQEEVVAAVAEVGSIVLAQEALVNDHSTLVVMKQDMKSLRREVDNALGVEVAEFVAETTEDEVNEYLTELLETVGNRAEAVVDGNEVFDEVSTKLELAEESLVEKDLVEAVVSALEAEQALDGLESQLKDKAKEKQQDRNDDEVVATTTPSSDE